MITQVKNFSRIFIRRFLKTVSYTALILLILLTIIVIGFRTIYVQEKVGELVSKELSEYLKYTVKIERVQIDWFDHFTVSGISLYDYKGSRMIHLGEALVDYKFFTLERKFTFRIEDIVLKDGEVHLIKYKGTDILNINEFIDAAAKLGNAQDTTAAKEAFKLDDIKLVNMRFAYDDMRKDNISGFDHNHFSFDSIYGITENLYAFADTFRIDIKDLTTIEGHTRLRVHKLTGTYTLCGHYMDLENMYAHIGNTVLQDYMKISYGTITDLADFNTEAYINANLDSSFVDLKDIRFFAPELVRYPYRFAISCKAAGKVSKFNISKLSLYTGQSHVKGSVHMDGLPNFFKTYIDANLTDVYISQKDLAPFFDTEIARTIRDFGHFKGSVEFNGLPKSFIANAALNTAIGYFKTDMTFRLEKKLSESYYSGKLITNNLNLGKIIRNDQFGNINMNGSVEGTGFDIDDLKLKMLATIHSIEFNKYKYKNIHTDAIIQKSLFNGHADIIDSNLVMNIDGMLDYRMPEKILQVTIGCEKAQLKKLNLNYFNKDLLVKTKVFIDFKGTEIDDAVGKGYLADTYLLYNGNKEIFVDTLELISAINTDTSRTLEINSSIISASVNGHFKPTVMLHDFTEFVTEVSNSVLDDSLEVLQYYKDKIAHQEVPYNISYDIKLHDINAFLNIYTPGLYISGESSIKGRFNSGRTKILRSRAYIDTLYYKGYEFRKNKIVLFCSQKSDSSAVLGNITINSEEQINPDLLETENLVFESVLSGEQATVYFGAKQKKTDNSTRINGTIDLYEPYNILTFDNSILSLGKKVWTFEDDRKIYFNSSSIKFDSISLYNTQQRITLVGESGSDGPSGSVLMNNIAIQDFSHLFSSVKLAGIVNGNIHLGELNLDSKLTIDDFHVDTLFIGDVDGKAVWNAANKQMNLNVDVLRNNNNTFNLTGYYVPESDARSEEINLVAQFKESDISPLNAIAEGIFTNISGKATGYLTIKGSLTEPVVKGEIDVAHGTFKIPFLGTTYHFSDKIELKDDRISFDNVQLHDVNERVCHITGGLNHSHFKDFVLDFKGTVPLQHGNGFQALNLKENEGDMFYGEAYVTGNWEILGALNKIKIKANALSQQNTQIFIPLNTYTGVEHESYIRFVDPNRKSANIDQKKKLDLSGIEMEFNFAVTPDAYTEIIFDKKAGDIIRGNGTGNMRMTIDTRGDFNMFGSYEITKGKYNFTLAGIINKEFTIDPGSTIRWMGDPYEAELNINTRYRIFTSLKPILTGAPEDLTESPDAQRKYPVNVLMGLKGNLKSPEVNLGINIENKYPGQFAGYVTNFETYVASNPSEMNKQAFSVIVLRKLSPIGNGLSDANSTYANLSELLSNQLSSFVSQIDENLEINVDLTTLDKNGLNTFNMRFAYTALDGRLRISHQSGNYSNTATTATNIVGEWTVEYVLTPSGNLKAKVYNKINQNALITSTTTTTTMAAGMSLQHVQGFDKIGEIFKNKNKEQKEKKRKAPKQMWSPYKEEDDE